MCQCIYCLPTPSGIWNSKSRVTSSSLVTAVTQDLACCGCSSNNVPMGDRMNLNVPGKFSVLQISSAYRHIGFSFFFFSLQYLVKGIKVFLIIKVSFCQPELAASPTTVRISLFTATPLPDVVGACFLFPSTTQTSHVFQNHMEVER